MTFNVYEIVEDDFTKVQEEEEDWVSDIIGNSFFVSFSDHKI